jgi:hypothetical protein
MRKSIFIAVSTCLLSVAAFSSSFAGNLSEQDLQRITAKLNKRYPVNVDRETRLDNTSAGPGRSFSYNYTFINNRSTEYNKQEFTTKMRQKLIGQVCSSSDLAKFLKNDVTVRYCYKGNDGGVIGVIPFTRRDCNY